MQKIGFGGSCHWCTEAIFQALAGVSEVQQGWIASAQPNDSFSEAVIIEFNPALIPLATLIEIHLYTHSCTSNHNMRSKYRSAIYYFSSEQKIEASAVLITLKTEFIAPIITKVLPFLQFKLNKEEYLNYYKSNPEKPFCENYITPKLKLLLNRYAKYMRVIK